MNLGFHWKLIQVSEDRRIAWSETTLGGELANAVWRETILADALPVPPGGQFNEPWVGAGRHAARELEFARALFEVRLLHGAGNTSPDDRLGFFFGAFIEAHLQPWVKRRRIRPGDKVTIVGSSSLAAAWQAALAEHDVEASVVTMDCAEHSFVTGLAEILARTSLLRRST
jgi:2-keto-3-deoxy-galactonokinase